MLAVSRLKEREWKSLQGDGDSNGRKGNPEYGNPEGYPERIGVKIQGSCSSSKVFCETQKRDGVCSLMGKITKGQGLPVYWVGFVALQASGACVLGRSCLLDPSLEEKQKGVENQTLEDYMEATFIVREPRLLFWKKCLLQRDSMDAWGTGFIGP